METIFSDHSGIELEINNTNNNIFDMLKYLSISYFK